MSKKKLLWISDAANIMHVGQSVVSRECLSRLQKWYDVENLGFGGGETPPQNSVKVPFNIIPCIRTDMHDLVKLSQFIDASKPDVVVLSHDPWMIPIIGDVKKKYPHIKFCAYMTIDGEPCYYGWYPFIRPYDKIITPSHFSQKAMLDRWMNLNVDVVPYGIDHNTFRLPQQGKRKLKEEITAHHRGTIYERYINLNNRFVGIFAGANQDRKNLGLIHEAWREFEKGKENNVVFLMFVHSAHLKEEMGTYDLSVFMHDSKTLKIIQFPQPLDILGQFFAASDILFHPSHGEGFGLTVMEAMACGTVPVTIPYAAVSDFSRPDNSYQLPYIKHVGGYHTHRALTAPENAVEALNDAYHNVEKRIMLANNAIKTAQNYTWDSCAEGLRKSLEDVLAREPNTLYVQRV